MKNVYSQAAKNLRGHWHKGSYSDGHGNYCAVGHIAAVRGADPDSKSFRENQYFQPGEVEFLNELVIEMTDGKFQFVAHFNDDKDTTEDDVIALLKRAAKRTKSNV